MNDYSYKMQSMFYSKLTYPYHDQTEKDEYSEIFILLAKNKFII